MGSIKVIKRTDSIFIETIVVLLYGSPGTGKTSMAFTADKPILLDFDLGAQRGINRKDVIRIKTWHDIDGLELNDLKEFNTIIIDTVGRMLEAMEELIKTSNEKMIIRATGGLSQPGWGLLGTMFNNFIKKMQSFNKDIVFIAHEVGEKKNEETFMGIDASGKSKVKLHKLADILGYMSLKGSKRFLSFNPTEEHLGKNYTEIPDQNIPHLRDEPTFLKDLIQLTKDKMNSKSAEQIKAEQEFQDVLNDIHLIDNLKDCNKMLNMLKEGDPAHKTALVNHAKKLGFNLLKSKDKIEFIVPSKEDTAVNE